MSEKIKSTVSKMDQMIHDAIETVDALDDIYLANAIIQANKNARFPGYGMAVTSGLLKKRDAAIRKAAMEEAADRMKEAYKKVFADDMEGNREYAIEAMRLAIITIEEAEGCRFRCFMRNSPAVDL